MATGPFAEFRTRPKGSLFSGAAKFRPSGEPFHCPKPETPATHPPHIPDTVILSAKTGWCSKRWRG